MSYFGDELDNIIGNNNPLNQNIFGENFDENNEQQNDDADGGDGDGDTSTTKKVEPKKRTIRNPQPRLNVDRLMGERGIQDIETYFQNIKYMGKGYERQDLNNVMKRLEHWAHRLYPKFNFDDFLTKTETLGKKKQIQTHMNRYRLGMLERKLPMDQILSDSENNPDDNRETIDGNQLEEQPIDEYDQLIGEQIEKYKNMPPRTPKTPHSVYSHSSATANDALFESLHNATNSTIITTPKFMLNKQNIQASTPLSDICPLSVDDDVTNGNSQPEEIVQKPKLTPEQMARIAENRRIAQERLRAKKAGTPILTTVIE